MTDPYLAAAMQKSMAMYPQYYQNAAWAQPYKIQSQNLNQSKFVSTLNPDVKKKLATQGMSGSIPKGTKKGTINTIQVNAPQLNFGTDWRKKQMNYVEYPARGTGEGYKGPYTPAYAQQLDYQASINNFRGGEKNSQGIIPNTYFAMYAGPKDKLQRESDYVNTSMMLEKYQGGNYKPNVSGAPKPQKPQRINFNLGKDQFFTEENQRMTNEEKIKAQKIKVQRNTPAHREQMLQKINAERISNRNGFIGPVIPQGVKTIPQGFEPMTQTQQVTENQIYPWMNPNAQKQNNLNSEGWLQGESQQEIPITNWYDKGYSPNKTPQPQKSNTKWVEDFSKNPIIESGGYLNNEVDNFLASTLRASTDMFGAGANRSKEEQAKIDKLIPEKGWIAEPQQEMALDILADTTAESGFALKPSEKYLLEPTKESSDIWNTGLQKAYQSVKNKPVQNVIVGTGEFFAMGGDELGKLTATTISKVAPKFAKKTVEKPFETIVERAGTEYVPEKIGIGKSKEDILASPYAPTKNVSIKKTPSWLGLLKAQSGEDVSMLSGDRYIQDVTVTQGRKLTDKDIKIAREMNAKDLESIKNQREMNILAKDIEGKSIKDQNIDNFYPNVQENLITKAWRKGTDEANYFGDLSNFVTEAEKNPSKVPSLLQREPYFENPLKLDAKNTPLGYGQSIKYNSKTGKLDITYPKSSMEPTASKGQKLVDQEFQIPELQNINNVRKSKVASQEAIYGDAEKSLSKYEDIYPNNNQKLFSGGTSKNFGFKTESKLETLNPELKPSKIVKGSKGSRVPYLGEYVAGAGLAIGTGYLLMNKQEEKPPKNKYAIAIPWMVGQGQDQGSKNPNSNNPNQNQKNRQTGIIGLDQYQNWDQALENQQKQKQPQVQSYTQIYETPYDFGNPQQQGPQQKPRQVFDIPPEYDNLYPLPPYKPTIIGGEGGFGGSEKSDNAMKYWRVFAAADQPFGETDLPVGEYVDRQYFFEEIPQALSYKKIAKVNAEYGNMDAPMDIGIEVNDMFGLNPKRKKARKSK